MNYRLTTHLLLSVSALAVVGCFSPNEAIDDESGATDPETETGSETATASGTGGMTGSGDTSGGATSVTAGQTTSAGGPSGGPTTETSSETGGETDSGADSTASTETDPTGDPPAVCGDGELQADEECDDGDNNGAGSPCTEMCTNNACGDGLIAGDEACDDGDDNGTGDGDCAPDCSTLVETKVIRLNILNSTNMDGNMGGANAPTVLDTGCVDSGLPGYRAMFADGVARRASVTPNMGDGQIDWVLQPWTRYVNGLGGLVWTTDETALLGVDGGASVALLAPIDSSGGFGVGSVVTGMQQNWVAQDGSMCNGNSSSSPGNFRPTADPSSTVNGAYLADNAGAVNCMVSLKYYCVEQ